MLVLIFIFHVAMFAAGILSGRREVRNMEVHAGRCAGRNDRLSHSPFEDTVPYCTRQPVDRGHLPLCVAAAAAAACGVGAARAWVFCALPTNVDGAHHWTHCRLDDVLPTPAATPAGT